jgi:CubicO group peptidase (beta-lactamase class C family)
MDLAAALAAAGLPAGTPVTIAAVDASGTIHSAVAGNWSDGRPVLPDDRFYGASLAKQLTGALIAGLVRRTGLDPDMPIGAALPDLPVWSKGVTVRHLLHHLGGLPLVDPTAGPAHWDQREALRLLGAGQHLASPPGSRYDYSNLGYVCLALLVECTCNLPFAAAAEQHLLKPLALTGIGFSTAPDYPQLAGMGAVEPRTVGDGGLWTTAAAFAGWLDAQNRDALGVADLVQQPHGVATDYGWGLGLRSLHDHPLYIHGGGWPGSRAKAVRCPALGIGVVALAATNDGARVEALVDRIAAAMATGVELS